MTDDELKTLFAALKEMRENETEEQAQEARISFAFGNASISNPLITRELIEKAAIYSIADSLNKTQQLKIILKHQRLNLS